MRLGQSMLLGNQKGMTLVELITVLLILAILSTIAVSSYRRYALRAQRTDAKAALLRIQVAEEKYFLQNGKYTVDFKTAPPVGLGVLGSSTTDGGYYTITVGPDPGGTNDIATSYLATAAAIGNQTQDTGCTTFTINDRGTHTPLDSTGCWR